MSKQSELETINNINNNENKIEIDQIVPDDPIQKNKIQLEAKIYCMIDGKKETLDVETNFMHQKYPGFAPKKFIEAKQRDFVRFTIDPAQESCIELENNINKDDDCYEANRKNVHGKYDKLYKLIRSIKKPKISTEEEISDSENDEKELKDNKPVEPKYNSCKMKLKMNWFYYYDNERLDKSNTNIIKKTIYDVTAKHKNLDKEKRKALINTLSFKLNLKDQNNVVSTKEIRMDEIEQRREIDTKIFYRNPQTVTPEGIELIKKIRGKSNREIEEYENKIIEYFGEPGDCKDVRSPDDLDKYYRYNCYVRILYSPDRVWASKTKDEDVEVDGKIIPGKRKSGIKYIINSIDIIQMPSENNYTASHKLIYSKYAFGKNNTNTNNVFSKSNENTSNDRVEEKNLNIINKKEINSKVEIDISKSSDNSDESDESEESDDSESESESDDSDSSDKKKSVKNNKQKEIVSNTKNAKTKDVKKTK
jgi:hypothetical protein